MKIQAETEDKERWKVVRRDTFADVPGDIVEADDQTGQCKMSVKDADGAMKVVDHDFQPGGMMIVRRR